MVLPSDRSFTASLANARRTSFCERHKPIAVVTILGRFFLPSPDMVVCRRVVGVLAAVILSVFAYDLKSLLQSKSLGRTGDMNVPALSSNLFTEKEFPRC